MIGHEKIVDILIQAGADIEARQEDGWTPLHLAAERGEFVVFRISLSLLMSKYFGFINIDQEKVVDLLIHSGSDFDAFGDSNRTPLYFAAKKGNLNQILKIILKWTRNDVFLIHLFRFCKSG